MSRKISCVNENNLFVKNINKLVDNNGGRTAFAGQIGVNYDTVRSWCLGKYLPGGDYLIIIREKFGVSIDWLLTGKENHIVSEPATGYNNTSFYDCVLPKEICEQVKEIIESNHPVIKPALISNLAALQYGIRKEKSQEK